MGKHKGNYKGNPCILQRKLQYGNPCPPCGHTAVTRWRERHGSNLQYVRTVLYSRHIARSSQVREFRKRGQVVPTSRASVLYSRRRYQKPHDGGAENRILFTFCEQTDKIMFCSYRFIILLKFVAIKIFPKILGIIFSL